MRVAVLGGAGKTARAVSEALLRRGATAVPVGRREWGRLAGALEGCDAAYLVAPNLHPDEPGLLGEALAAARTAGVPRVVHHSVASPYAPSMPHHLGKAVTEDLVRRSGLAWTILQPGAYVQNLVPALRGPEPAVRVPYAVDVCFGLVDLADVAEAAATVLLGPGHHGATYELGGPSPTTLREVATAAAVVLGRPVPVERVDPRTWSGPDDERERDWLLRMFGYYDQHGLPVGPLPLRALLGRRATDVAATLARELGAGP